MEKETKKRVLRKYIFISFLLIAIAISILLMIKYNVEGEKNMPFQINKIVIQSTLDAQSRESENLWDLGLTQNNDIYIYIEKNKNLQDNQKIKSIKINRMSITEKNEVGNISVYLPTNNKANQIYSASTENYFNQNISYYANTSDNLERQEICQDGGMIAFRVSNENIGEYVSNEGVEIKYDKSLLEKAGIQEEKIKFTFEIDLIIELDNDEKYKGTISLDLPIDTFEKGGSVNKEITDLKHITFKRT